MSDKFKWEPWYEFATEGEAVLDTPLRIKEITETPCKHCEHFAPTRAVNGCSYAGVTICHSEKMHSDFSCFRLKKEKP